MQDCRGWNGVALLDYNDNHGVLQRLWGGMTSMVYWRAYLKTHIQKQAYDLQYPTQGQSRERDSCVWKNKIINLISYHTHKIRTFT